MKMKCYEIPMKFRGVVFVKAYCQADAESCIEEMSDDEIFNNCYGSWEADGEIEEYETSFDAVDAYDWIDHGTDEENEEEENEEEDE